MEFFFAEEWNEAEIHAFTEALDKFNHDWTQIAEYVHRSEESCRAFYYKKQRKNISPSDDHVIDFLINIKIFILFFFFK